AEPTPTPEPVAGEGEVFVSRVTAGRGEVRDASGQVWSPRSTGFGGWGNATAGSVSGTSDPELYRHTAPWIKWYRLDVPAAAEYQVRLLFAEPWYDQVGRRVFDVAAEGQTVVSGLDIVKEVGRGAAHEVTFTVPVTDGRLDLEFTASAESPVLSAVEVMSTTPVAPQEPVKPLVTIAPDSFFTEDISRAPLAHNSAEAAENLRRQVADNWGGVAAFNAYQYNNSFHAVSSSVPKQTVQFYDCQKKGYLPSGLLDGPKYFADVPIPAGAVPANGTDKQMTIYDESADQLWDFWVTERHGDGWRACWGGRLDDVSKNHGVFPAPYGATASGLAMTPGAISQESFRRGSIDHAMYLAIISPANYDKVSWPANRSDGWSHDPHALMEGQRVRLDPTLDLSQFDMTPVARMVAEAAQTYGFIVADKAGAVAVITESGDTEKARTGTNPWDSMLAGPAHEAMRGFPWEHMQVLPKDYGKR
ncbi:MAG: malectin domain-containing carbohydrate-binding protein, partial [Mobilicoccus sp.]|nr:malectin domain-containing carbohydrate-binding protein [Mobilicoccus sp.]